MLSTPRGPIVTVGLVAYGIVSVSPLLGTVLRPMLGEGADVFMMLGYLWPYPLFLSLQGVLSGEGLAARIALGAAVLLGLVTVWWFTGHVQRRLGYETWSNPRAYLWAPWLWSIPLIALQATVYASAFLLGAPVGE
jgi:hypothetical protein